MAGSTRWRSIGPIATHWRSEIWFLARATSCSLTTVLYRDLRDRRSIQHHGFPYVWQYQHVDKYRCLLRFDQRQFDICVDECPNEQFHCQLSQSAVEKTLITINRDIVTPLAPNRRIINHESLNVVGSGGKWQVTFATAGLYDVRVSKLAA